MHVIGTAGHVDHGKSTLIQALTGINPDRLKEEQERLMTIDLGFAWLALPGGEEIGIVDVPGHRDFIGNMLAGVAGLDAVLLVIAADEGVMPQTREHLAILDLLEIRHGIVVLTKIDLVDDPAWLDLVEFDVRTLLQNSSLMDAPILHVSSRTKKGFPELLQNLELLLGNLPSRPDLGRPRLPIDRVFSIVGFGTIVTGTLSDGKLLAGEEVEILPSGLHARIRGLQTHKKNVEIAIPSSRLAVNLSGVELEQVIRGHVVTHPGQYRSTQRLDGQFRLLEGVKKPLNHNMEVKLFIGATETIATVRLLGMEVINPGDTGWIQLELHAPVVAVRGDHFILRRPSPGETIGGGVVVDPQPGKRHRRFDLSVLKSLESLTQGSPADVLLQACTTLGPAVLKDVLKRSQLEEPAASLALQELLDAGQAVLLQEMVVVAAQLSIIESTVVAALASYHKTHPLRRGMPREELKSRLELTPRFFNLVMHRLATEKTITDAFSLVSLSGHKVKFTFSQQVKVNGLLEQFAMNPYSPPSVKDCQAQVGEDVFIALIDFGDLVAVSTEIVFRKSDYDIMLEKIRETCRKKGQVSLGEVRDIFNTSRRYAQALLEHLDVIGVTIRSGDFRTLKS
jgi:selenocysteine-specific elongation factor